MCLIVVIETAVELETSRDTSMQLKHHTKIYRRIILVTASY